MLPRLVSVVVAALVATPGVRAAGLPAGNYILSVGRGPLALQRLAVLAVETKDGKPAVRVADALPTDNFGNQLVVRDGKAAGPVPGAALRPAGYTAGGLTIDGSTVCMTLDLGRAIIEFNDTINMKAGTQQTTSGAAGAQTFEGVLDPADPKLVRGSLAAGGRVSRAVLERTDKAKLEPADATFSLPMPAEFQAAQKRRMGFYEGMQKAAGATDPADKAKFQREAEAARAASDAEMPALFRKMLADHPNTPAGLLAARALMTGAVRAKAPAGDVAGWAAAIEVDAARHGPRLARAAVRRLAESLVTADEYAALAVPYAERVVATPNLTGPGRLQALRLLADAQAKAGRADAAAATRRDIAKLDGDLDDEFLRTVPAFKPARYAGRQTPGANRVPVVELFTGSQCGPCVAADVAFDALAEAYSVRDVVLLQYHLHVPSADPLANPDTAARFDYYGKLAEKEFMGTPSVALDGRPGPRAGGDMADAEPNFNTYKKLIDASLEQTTFVKLSGAVRKRAGVWSVAVDVAGVDPAKDGIKLRLVVTEARVRYVAGNGLRFHRHVVRGMLGTAAGVPVVGLKGGRHTAELTVDSLRAGLSKHLDTANNGGEPFPPSARPLELKDLRVVALVQDDATGAILQAAVISPVDE